MLNIYVARHGQDEDNANGILNGHRNRPLTGLGINQARILAQKIKEAGLTFEAVYSSSLLRAHRTATTVTDALDIAKPTVMMKLIERNFGVMTGKRVADIPALCGPKVIHAGKVCYFLQPQGSETFPMALHRAQEVIDEIRCKHPDGNVLLVTHGDMGKMLYAAYYGIPWEEALVHFDFKNASLIRLAEGIAPEEASCLFEECVPAAV